MMKDILKFSCVGVLALFCVFGMAGGALATLTMEEVRELFKKETGMDWIDASDDLKKNFLLELTEESPHEGLDSSVRIQQSKDLPPFGIRYNFEKTTGRAWDTASQDEQKKFLKTQMLIEKGMLKKEKTWIKEQEKQEKLIRKELEEEEKRILKKKKERKKREREEKKEEEKRRKREKKKIEEAKKRLKKLQKDSQRKH